MLMNRLYAMDANVLFACSEEAGKYMFGKKKFEVINNAIITDNYTFCESTRNRKRRELGIEDKFVIGSIGRFELQKNQKFSIEVFETIKDICPDAVLILIGSGSMVEEIRRFVAQKGLEKCIFFLGNRRDVAELYQAMDVFLMPSLFEGLGIVAVEAQAAGTPVVCTDTLPKEINVSPLINRVSLSAQAEEWAKIILKAAENPNCHCNMKNYIMANDYDMDVLAKKMQNFYLEKNAY